MRTNLHLAAQLASSIDNDPKNCPMPPPDSWYHYKNRIYVKLPLEYFLSDVAFNFLITFGTVWAKNDDTFI